jgi:hypothetical protein
MKAAAVNIKNANTIISIVSRVKSKFPIENNFSGMAGKMKWRVIKIEKIEGMPNSETALKSTCFFI